MQSTTHHVTPDQIVNQSLDKQRIVITGSRGTLTLSALLIHVLRYHKRAVDYIISGPAHGISDSTHLSDAPIIIIEAQADQMIKYNHHVGLITNILWSLSKEFPNEEDFVKQYDSFADNTPKGGILLYCENDPLALLIGSKARTDVNGIGYTIHPHTSENGKHFLTSGKDRIPVAIVGSQNFQNISGAKELLKRLGITYEMFYKAIITFG